MSKPARVIAVDWSGDRRRPHRKIWLAEVADGELRRLESGRNREALTEHLIAEARENPELVIGLDFAFSLPAWYLAELGLRSAPELWDLVAREGERWLQECSLPFWGRPGRKRPDLEEHLRRTEREAPATGGIRPKSVFQIGGAGAVGTGSLRGMPTLKRLREAGLAIWPFDSSRYPLVIEIYPRLLTGPVDKGNQASREGHLAQYANRLGSLATIAASSEDAFDAVISALVMDDSGAEFAKLSRPTDQDLIREGLIWTCLPLRSVQSRIA